MNQIINFRLKFSKRRNVYYILNSFHVILIVMLTNKCENILK